MRDSAELHPLTFAWAILIGLATGVLTTGLRYLVNDVVGPDLLSSDNTVLLAIVPAAGILLSGLLLRFFADQPDVHDAEAYLAAYHKRETDTRIGSFIAKVAAAAATLGSGAAASLEGPSLYIGSILGAEATKRIPHAGSGHDRPRTLLVAGAAAGISAVFKTPLTGLIFALELPYTDDFAREALIPSMLSSASSYLVAISLLGPEPLFQVDRAYVPSAPHMLLALALGVFVGLSASLFLASLRLAEWLAARARLSLVARTAIGGVLCSAFGMASYLLYHSPLAIGGGYRLIDAASAGTYIGLTAAVLFVLRGGAVVATLGSGAAGGSFIPQVSLGAIAGAAFAVVAPATGSLFPIIGMAAFLAAGNATPIAGAVFVAESTGAAGYVIPGLVAAAAACFVARGRTLSEGRRPPRRS